MPWKVFFICLAAIIIYIIFPIPLYSLGGFLETAFRCEDVTDLGGPMDLNLELHCRGYENWQDTIEALLDFWWASIFTLYTGLIALALLIIIQVILIVIKFILR